MSNRLTIKIYPQTRIWPWLLRPTVDAGQRGTAGRDAHIGWRKYRGDCVILFIWLYWTKLCKMYTSHFPLVSVVRLFLWKLQRGVRMRCFNVRFNRLEAPPSDFKNMDSSRSTRDGAWLKALLFHEKERAQFPRVNVRARLVSFSPINII